MNRKLLWSLLVIGAIVVLWALILPPITGVHNRDSVPRVLTDTRQAGLAARVYAENHEGRLPESLDDLVPGYLPDKALLVHTCLAAPHALLSEVPQESIILFRVTTDQDGRTTGVVVVRPDLSYEWKKL